MSSNFSIELLSHIYRKRPVDADFTFKIKKSKATLKY